MDQTNENAQERKPKISKMAVISLIFCAWAFAMAAVSLTIWFDMRAVGLCILLITLSIIFGIGALLSRKEVRGSKMAWLSIAASAVLYFELGPAIDTKKRITICKNNLLSLGKFFSLYSQDNNGKYPTADKWCDLLVKYSDSSEEQYVYPGALKSGDQGSCHYAINPNCGPNSPPDTVLLFETKGGWNQYGGLELLTTEHFDGDGCNILFNDTQVRFIRTEHLGELKWGTEPKRKEDK